MTVSLDPRFLRILFKNFQNKKKKLKYFYCFMGHLVLKEDTIDSLYRKVHLLGMFCFKRTTVYGNKWYNISSKSQRNYLSFDERIYELKERSRVFGLKEFLNIFISLIGCLLSIVIVNEILWTIIIIIITFGFPGWRPPKGLPLPSVTCCD